MVTQIPSVHPAYASRLAERQNSQYTEIWDCLDVVCDPELPGVSLWDLGVLQTVGINEKTIHIGITLTYSGCPAVHTMKDDIKARLEAEYPDYISEIKVLLAPAWTTDFMSPEAKHKLAKINIVAPNADNEVNCPQCQSQNTRLISQFGSTACKAMYSCEDCAEVFDYFKVL